MKKYQIYNEYTDSLVGFADSFEEAQEIASLTDAMCQESEEWIPWCVITEVE